MTTHPQLSFAEQMKMNLATLGRFRIFIFLFSLVSILVSIFLIPSKKSVYESSTQIQIGYLSESRRSIKTSDGITSQLNSLIVVEAQAAPVVAALEGKPISSLVDLGVRTPPGGDSVAELKIRLKSEDALKLLTDHVLNQLMADHDLVYQERVVVPKARLEILLKKFEANEEKLSSSKSASMNIQNSIVHDYFEVKALEIEKRLLILEQSLPTRIISGPSFVEVSHKRGVWVLALFTGLGSLLVASFLVLGLARPKDSSNSI